MDRDHAASRKWREIEAGAVENMVLVAPQGAFLTESGDLAIQIDCPRARQQASAEVTQVSGLALHANELCIESSTTEIA